MDSDPLYTVVRMPGVQFVNGIHQAKILGTFTRRCVVKTGTAKSQKFALPADAQMRMVSFDQPVKLPLVRCLKVQIFF